MERINIGQKYHHTNTPPSCLRHSSIINMLGVGSQRWGPDIPFFGKPAMRMVGAAPQTQTNESVFAISDMNKYMLGSRYPQCATGLNTGCTSEVQVSPCTIPDTRTCHLHRESRLTTHTDITPPHLSRPWSKQWVDNSNNKRFSSYENLCHCQDDCS